MAWLAQAQHRLQSLSWFMKGLTRQGRKSEIRNSKSETNPKSKSEWPRVLCCRDGVPQRRSLAVAAEESGPGSTPQAFFASVASASARLGATGFATRGQPGRMPGILTPLRNPDQSPVRHRLVPSPESPLRSARRGPPKPRSGRDAGAEKPVADTASSGVPVVLGAVWSSGRSWSRKRLKEVAEQLGLRRMPNLAGCPAT